MKYFNKSVTSGFYCHDWIQFCVENTIAVILFKNLKKKTSEIFLLCL